MITENSKRQQIGKILLILLAGCYSLYAIYLTRVADESPSKSLGLGFAFLYLWIIGAVLLGLLLLLTKYKPSGIIDYVALLFATPIPTIILFVIWIYK